MSPPPRILISGDPRGNLNALFKRVTSVNKSTGPFDSLLCVGQFFPDSSEQVDELTEYIEGRKNIPLPTYFIGDYGAGAVKVLNAAANEKCNLGFKMEGLKLRDNLFWLKGSGKFILNGLSVAYLSGRKSSSGVMYGTYSQDDVDVLRAGILNRASTSDVPPGISDLAGSDATVSELVAEIKPRYHIAGTKGVFYAREPYMNADGLHVTRFLGLAAVGNASKQKFIHAISPTPASTMSSAEISIKPPNTTLSPYTYVEKSANTREAEKRSADDANDSQYWRYDVSKRQKGGGGDTEKLCFKFITSGSCPRGENCHFRHDMDAREQSMRGVCFELLNKGKCEKGEDCTYKHTLQEERSRSRECWFCLSSPNVESHLITSVGENCYCAIAKGPLVQDHILILPIEHLPNTLSSPPECEMELVKFQNSLKAYFKSHKKEVVFFEWVYIKTSHANLQAIPIPVNRASAVQDIFNLAAEKLGFKFMVSKCDKSSEGRKLLRAQYDGKCSLFYVELPGGTILSHPVEENEKFPVQFGREVLAGLLNMADRADWRNCKLSKDEEIKMAERFKISFEDYDPNRLECAYTVYPILPVILNQSRIIWEVEFFEGWKPLSPLQLAMEEVMSE
ncbi:zinc finger CCCH domain-containing protein 64 [Tanacetum coccineum]